MKRKLLSIVIFLLSIGVVLAQRTVSGKVTSADDGSGIPGVNVVLKGTTTGSTTDIDGNFRVSVPEEGGTLVFSFIGLLTQEQVIGARSVIDVSMQSDITQLTEVVVVGYGEQSSRLNLQAVSTIKSESFKNLNAVSPQQLLQGQAAGVQMVNSSGLLGAQSTVRIRGASSISAGSSPLYVVDGIPMNDGGNGGFSSAQGAGTGLNPILDINPNDIESMSVLKDAAAVAIYGSRGANGVVIIKTKRGSQDGKTKINFDYSTGFSKPTSLLKYMDNTQFKTFLTDYNTARGTAVPVLPDTGFDWVDAVVQTGKVSNYNLSMTGGSDKTSFFVGIGYHDESGFTIGNTLERLSGRINLNHKVNDRIRAGVNLALSSTYSDRIGAENNTFAPLTSSYLQTPTVQPRDADGKFVNTGFIRNVLLLEAENDNDFYLRRQVGSIFAEADLITGLTFRTEFGIDLTQSEEKSRDVNVNTPGGFGSRFVNQDYKWLTTNTLRYSKDISDHSINLLLGQSYETAANEFIQVAGTGFVSDQLRNVSSASTKTTTEANGTAWGLESFFARANYGFKGKYLAEASVRRDGSSRFGADKRYGNFWAVSAGWILSEESFISGISQIDLLKLTASYGTSGNDRLGNFPSLPLFGAGVAADYAGSAGLIPTQNPNPLLGWEETAQLDIGIAASILKSRVSFEVNYYVKNTTGLLANVPLPLTTGFANTQANVGEMRNKGWDINVNTVNIQKSNFRWSTNFNIGLLDNEVLKLPENKDLQGRDFLAGSAAQRAVVGHSQNSFYVIRYAGINSETGEAEWLNIDGERTITPTANDRVIAGSAIPKFNGGLSNNFKYGDFDLGVLFNFTYGNKVLIDGLRFTENMGGTFNKSTDLFNYWKQPGDKAFAPGLAAATAGAGRFNQLSTLTLQNGSFMRLRYVTFGYNLPQSIIDKVGVIQSLRVFVMGQNLWTLQDKDFRGPDPEVSANGANTQILGESFFALPQAKTITFGLNLSF